MKQVGNISILLSLHLIWPCGNMHETKYGNQKSLLRLLYKFRGIQVLPENYSFCIVLCLFHNALITVRIILRMNFYTLQMIKFEEHSAMLIFASRN
jgi:hypothetical protein